MMEYSKDQEEALAKMQAWYKERDPSNKKQQVFYLAGWAGTGKTTIANAFSRSLPSNTKILYGSFTGKAALRMRQAGMGNARTLHSMIYSASVDPKTKKLKFTLDQNSVLKHGHLLILDECSMVDRQLGEDVLSFGVPVLILGDQGQLPPVKGTGFFTSRKPNAVLNEVHRQALDNPIIELATTIRKGGSVKKFYSDQLITYPKKEETMRLIMESGQVLCGRNNVRRNANALIRSMKGHTSDWPERGEKIICLRNNHRENLFNGMMGYMEDDASDKHGVVILPFYDDEENSYLVEAHPEGFEDDELLKGMDYHLKNQLNEFTYGYAITVHKSQGSQWDSVCLLDDGMFVWDRQTRRQWLYTAVTRAAEKLVLLKAPQELK